MRRWEHSAEGVKIHFYTAMYTEKLEAYQLAALKMLLKDNSHPAAPAPKLPFLSPPPTPHDHSEETAQRDGTKEE